MEHTNTLIITDEKLNGFTFPVPVLDKLYPNYTVRSKSKGLPPRRTGFLFMPPWTMNDPCGPQVLPTGSSVGSFQTYYLSLWKLLELPLWLLSALSQDPKSLTQPPPKASHLKLPDLERGPLSDGDTCSFFFFFCAHDVWKWKQSYLLSNLLGLFCCSVFFSLRQGQTK